MSTRRPYRGLEAAVLAALDDGDGPMTSAQVRTALGDDLAHTTVATVLTRLTAKGLVERRRAGRALLYAPTPDPSQVTAVRMRKLLDADDDRSAVLTRFVGDLSDDDEHLLRSMLDDTVPPEATR